MRKLAEESEEGELCCCSVGEEQRKGKGGFEKFKSFLFVCGEEEKKMVWAVGEGSPLLSRVDFYVPILFFFFFFLKLY